MTTAYESGKVPEIQVHHRLRIAREAVELEQSELADRMGVSRNTIGNAEKGRTRPRKILLNAWALACGVPVGWLETGNAESPRPDGDPNGGSQLPRLDSNQQPSD
ncbi:DNA-binding protein [Rhodococcus sp. 15-1154-1]|nr:helix-turn-helix transcriptional regulator [Rhodococcus sp. 15-1154-1]OZF00870.1 DNA-binding protein [Rhodococcus sp. 15-1154-1]